MRFQHHLSFSAWVLRLLPLVTALLAVHSENEMVEVDLVDHFKINDSYYYFTTSKVELSFLVHEQIESRMVDIKLYDSTECLAGTLEHPPTATDITVNNFISYERASAVDASKQERSIDLTLNIERSEIQTAPKLENNAVDNEAQLSLCVRSSVYSARLSDPRAVLRTWREDLVSLTFDTESNYDLKNATIYSLDKHDGIHVDRNLFEIKAFVCNFRFNPTDERPSDLASSVRICVEPALTEQEEAEPSEHEINFSIQGIDSFAFLSNEVKQHAVVDGEASSNGLSILECEVGSDVCSFATELIAPFFDSKGMISGRGTMSMRYGSAVVKDIPFEVEFPIEGTTFDEEDENDDPWYMTAVIAGLFLIVIVLFLILRVVRALKETGQDPETKDEHRALSKHSREKTATKTIRKGVV